MTAAASHDHKKNKTGKASFIRLRDTQKAMANAAMYTRFVSWLRWVLPFSVVAVVLVLFVWPMMNRRTVTAVLAEAVPNLVVENLRLTGINSNDEPYSLTAARALQVPSAKNVVDLERPRGELALSGDSWLAGRAEIGRYDQANKQLWLSGDVELFHDDGSQFDTSEVQVDLNRNNAWGSQPVSIQGKFGDIQGEGFRLLEGGKVMVITGKTKAHLNLHTASPSGSNKP